MSSPGRGPSNLTTEPVDVRDNSQAFVGSFGNITFASKTDPKEDLRKAVADCRNALFLTDPLIDRETLITAKGKRVEGTCEWIKGTEQYQSWLSGDARLLWICGGPGKGKTVLSIFLTQELEMNQQVVFYFCVSNDEKRNHAAAVLRGLLWQLTQRQPELTEGLLDHFDSNKKRLSSISSPEALWMMVTNLTQHPKLKNTIYVLDGLDECDEWSRRWLAKKLLGLNTGADTRSFQVIVVSRDLSELKGSLKVRLDPDNDELVSDDIRAFVSCKVQELWEMVEFDSHFRNYVEDTLLQRAKGTFLWVGFAMKELLEKQTCSEIEATLNALPPGLFPIYERMLRQIKPIDRAMSIRLLHWVTLALRPLTLEQLACAIGVTSSQHVSREQAIRDHVAICAPLLHMTQRSNRSDSCTVNLVHESAKEYLLRVETDDETVLEQFRIKPAEMQSQIAQTCVEALSKGNPLREYAEKYWQVHGRNATSLPTAWMEKTSFFAEKSPLRDIWWITGQIYSSIQKESIPRTLDWVHMACHLGIVSWLQLIIAQKGPQCLDATDDDGHTPIHYAAREGHTVIVGIILDHGIDVDSKDLKHITVLHAAALYGHQALVQLLLERGAEADVLDGSGRTALSRAASRGHENVARVLLDAGAMVNIKDGDGFRPLHHAAKSKVQAVVQLLLEYGAEVDAKDNRGQTPLAVAAYDGSDAVVRLLLKHGADPQAKDDSGLMPLRWYEYRLNGVRVQLPLESSSGVQTTSKYLKYQQLRYTSRMAGLLDGTAQ